MFELIKNVNIDFLSKRKLAGMISGAVILAGLVSIVLHGGPLYSIDFEGGTEIQVLFTESTSVESVREALSDIGYGDAAIRSFGNEDEFLIHVKTSTKSEEQVNTIREALASIHGGSYEIRRLETVGPKIGKELKGDMISAVLIAMAGIVIYISIRFQFMYAIGALVALTHDVLITLGLFSLLNMEISLSVLAAFLFIVGYSLNDTIVVFDRVRENLKACLNILKNNDYGTELQTNHLIQDHSQLKYQKEQYLKNWVNYLEINAEIWLTHNWSGLYGEESVARHTIFNERRKRTCGRPLAKVLEIRAGGLEGKKGAVVPCPNVLGQDSKAIMGYVEDQSLLEILNGEKMRHLREVHLRETFDEIDYCKNCDQLIDVEDALVWTNVPGRVYGESRISGISYVGAEKDWQNESV